MRYSGIGLVSLAILAAGCVQQPHNNVLLFGTDTKVALDVSSSATSGGAPQITLGYRRAEAVWMPLVVNEQVCDAAGNCRTETAKKGAEPYTLQGKDYEGDKGTDSYSVLASFGAKFESEATAGQAKAGGGLAQFFATGIAAQRLAANANIENALKVNNGAAAQGEAAKAEAEAKKTQAEARLLELKKELGEERYAPLKDASERENAIDQSETDLILSRCGGPEDDPAKWKALVTAAKSKGLSTAGEVTLSRITKNADAGATLRVNDSYRKPIVDNIGTLCT